MTLVYRPSHPEANENGMVDRVIAGERPRDAAPYVISDTIDGTWHPAFVVDQLDYESVIRPVTQTYRGRLRP
jgi:hypothetical protein